MILALILAAADLGVRTAHAADPADAPHRAGQGTSSGTTGTTPSSKTMKATATLEPRSGSKMAGTVTFSQEAVAPKPEGTMPGATPGTGVRPRITENGMKVSIKLTNASPGNHAVFLHETGDCSAPDASSVGMGFNPTGSSSPPSETMPPGSMGGGGEPGTPGASSGGPTGTMPTGGQPAGYLGFVTVNAQGMGEKELTTSAYSLSEGPMSINNRAVIVYEKAPDFTKATDPGARQACGVVKMQTAPGSLGSNDPL